MSLPTNKKCLVCHDQITNGAYYDSVSHWISIVAIFVENIPFQARMAMMTDWAELATFESWPTRDI